MITSTGNAQVKQLLQLKKKSKARNEQGVFLVEGIRMFEEVPKEQMVKAYCSETFSQKHGELVRGGTPMEVLSDTVFTYVSDTKTPQGILCIVKQRKYELKDIVEQDNPHLMVLDNLQDPGNLGTIVRTAEGAGVTGIILSRDCVDIYNPKTIRSTMGSIYRMPFVYVDDVEGMIETLKEHKIRVYAAHLEGKRAYDEADYREKTAFLIGNEGNGLREEVAEKADEWIRIPMCGQVESLNAAIASAVLMFEAYRQRR